MSSGPAPERTNLTLLMLNLLQAMNIEVYVVADAVVQTALNELKCLIPNEKISCFFNLLDMEIFFETQKCSR